MIIRLLPDIRVKNKTLANVKLLAGRQFKGLAHIAFEIKYFSKEGETTKYYTDGSLWHTARIVRKGNVKEICCYLPDGTLFSKERYVFNSDRSLSSYYNWIINGDGSITEHTENY